MIKSCIFFIVSVVTINSVLGLRSDFSEWSEIQTFPQIELEFGIPFHVKPEK